MSSKNVTITSKNQITIPAEYVRKLHLNKHRRLTIKQRGDELVLKVEPDLEERLHDVWAQLPAFTGTKTNEELKRTTHEAWSNKDA